ncbi:MAG: hypothetical protein M1829_000045 [Trizodia sp. TS-e1964]|nr:MAG: hypothetical protein M1829_000045 [Trizodia sp. TS-e1964]
MPETFSTYPCYYMIKDGIFMPPWLAYPLERAAKSGLLLYIFVSLSLATYMDILPSILLCATSAGLVTAVVKCTVQFMFSKDYVRPELLKGAAYLLSDLVRMMSLLSTILGLPLGLYLTTGFAQEVAKWLYCAFMGILVVMRLKAAWDCNVPAETNCTAQNPKAEVESLAEAEESRALAEEIEEPKAEIFKDPEDFDAADSAEEEDTGTPSSSSATPSDTLSHHVTIALPHGANSRQLSSTALVTPSPDASSYRVDLFVEVERAPAVIDEAEYADSLQQVHEMTLRVASLTVENLQLASNMAKLQHDVHMLTSNLARMALLSEAERGGCDEEEEEEDSELGYPRSRGYGRGHSSWDFGSVRG